MKLYSTFLTVSVLSILSIMGCSKSNPTSYVDGYSVNLTDAKGTTYTGDFFPLNPGYTCYYSGNENVTYTITQSGTQPETATDQYPTSGMWSVLPQTNVHLQSGTFSLFPIVEYSAVGINDTSRYCLKDTQGVSIKALKLPDGSFKEVTALLFFKSKLIVGDSWASSPQMEMTQALENQSGIGTSGLSLQYNGSAKTFVAGHEVVSLPIGTKNTVRIETANDISVSGSGVSEGISFSLSMTAQLAVVYNMIADTGIASQKISGTMTLTASAQGETEKIDVKITEISLGLSDIYTGPTISNVAKVSAPQKPVFKTPVQEKLWRISRTFLKAYVNQMGVQTQR